jgi:hypothetical protein
VDDFPSMKAAKLLAILTRQPLGYRVARQSFALGHDDVVIVHLVPTSV